MGNHKQSKERTRPSLKRYTSESHLTLPDLGSVSEMVREGTNQQLGVLASCVKLEVHKAKLLLMALCSVSRYLIILRSGRVVKRVLSFYRLLPQTSSNYKLDLYPGLFIA